MVCLAQSPRTKVATPTLLSLTRAPEQQLSRILQALSAAKLIKGHRGVNGGFAMTRDADQITVLDVVRAFKTLERIEACPLGLPSHDMHTCALHRCLDGAVEQIIMRFRAVTLQDIVDERSARIGENSDARTTLELKTTSGLNPHSKQAIVRDAKRRPSRSNRSS